MSDTDSPGIEHENFTKWAVAHGIKIKGVAPARFPGRRLGMIATRHIKVSMSCHFSLAHYITYGLYHCLMCVANQKAGE
jgi:hypothetical protein